MSVLDDPSTWRLKTLFLNVPYRLVERSGSFEEENATLTEKYIVEAHRLYEFAVEAFPGNEIVGDSIEYRGPGIRTNAPLYPKNIRWKAQVDGKPIDPFNVDTAANEGTYGKLAEVTINYETLPTGGGGSGPDPFTFLEITADTSASFIHSTAPAAKTVEESTSMNQPSNPPPPVNNRVLPTPVQILEPTTTWTVSFTQVPHGFIRDRLIDRIRNRLGMVNSVRMPIFFNAEPETVLFTGYSLRKQFTWRSNIQPPWRVDMKFLEKHVEWKGRVYGHNSVWKADEGWRRILYNGTDPIYDKTNLNLLFA